MGDSIEYNDSHHAIFGPGVHLTAREKALLLQIRTNLGDIWEDCTRRPKPKSLDEEWARITGFDTRRIKKLRAELKDGDNKLSAPQKRGAKVGPFNFLNSSNFSSNVHTKFGQV